VDFERKFVTPVDEALTVTGFIDRVDAWEHGENLFLRVSDYKTGRKSFDLSALRYGLGLQMLLYLRAVSEQDTSVGLTPVPSAALYMPARDALYPADTNLPDDKLQTELQKLLTRDGLILDDPVLIDAMERGDKRYLPIKTSRDGAYSGKSLISGEQIKQLTNLAMTKLRSTAESLRGGEISPDPYYKSPNDHACQYCDYAAACSFGLRERDNPKYIHKLPPDEFWAQISLESQDEAGSEGAQ
jgi:ATP-dependent helicase/nuclease subunit B